MTLDKTVAPHDQSNTIRRWVVGYTGPASYVTGGDPVDTNDDAAMGKIFAILGLVISNGTTIAIGWYDATNSTIVWYDMAGAQIANGVDLSTYTGRIEFVGV